MICTSVAADISLVAVENGISNLNLDPDKPQRVTLLCHEAHRDRLGEVYRLFLHDRYLRNKPRIIIEPVCALGVPLDFWFVSDGEEVVICGDR